MTRLPTDTSITALCDSIRALHQKPRDRRLPDPTLFAAIERRLLRAITRDRTGTTIRDGYPASTLGGNGHSNGSTTETHALARPLKDRHHELTVVAIRQLEGIVHRRQLLEAALDALDALTSDVGPTPRTCVACTGYRPQGGNQVVAHRGTVGDRLERDTDLCQACWDYVRQTATAGTHQGRLPTPMDIAYHDQRGRWQLRITT